MKDKKNILIAALLFVIVALSLGYATLAANLSVNGKATIKKWNVEITGITPTYTGDAQEAPAVSPATSPSYTASTATFSTILVNKSDTAEYVITVENKGELDAKLKTLTWNPASHDNGPIKYTVASGHSIGETLAAGTTTTFTVTVEYDNTFTGEITELNKIKTITGIIEYEQK